MTFKIGIILPIKSECSWKNIFDSHLYKHLISTFLKTYNKEHDYKFYCIFDDEDTIYANTEEQSILKKRVKLDIEFISSQGINPHHLTKMWNRAFERAYWDGCDYFFQCGDDIVFLDTNWVNKSIQKLQQNKNIGLTGPLDKLRMRTSIHSQIGGNRFIMTQAFVSRKHYELFKVFFPEEILNWYCDNFITNLYSPKYFYAIDSYIINIGGRPRYEIEGSLNPNCPVKKKWRN